MIQDTHMDRRGTTATKDIDFNFTSALSQTAALILSHQPGYNYEITGVHVFVQTYAATGSVDVQINGVTVLTAPVTPVTGTEVAGTLLSDVRLLRGTNAKPIQVKYTTNGTGVLTNPTVRISYRKVAIGGYSG